ncbi:MAG: 2-C-methyl-D-erythritol 4-phosphate cytidylyltransferase [Firmicutes bacterium]|nr:2-C-methyl-D-erythritol 4-phosphate cytidylyltransferase [Bacillota bacterium]
MEKIWAIVAAAGVGQRMMNASKGTKKQFIRLKGKELLVYSLEVFQKMDRIEGIVLVTGKEDVSFCESLVETYQLSKVAKVLVGGARRQESVFIGLSSLPKDCSAVVIHDGARPFVTEEDVSKTIDEALLCGGAILAVPVTDTIKVVGQDRKIEQTPQRSSLWAAQTPQTFRYPDILEGHRHAVVMGDFRCTDDAQIMEKYMDGTVRVVQGSEENLKITTPTDLLIAQRILEEREKKQAE